MGCKTKFKQGWLANLDSNGDRCSMYIQETESVYRARCDWCSCDFDTGSRGFLSIKDHSQKKKHRQVSKFYYFKFSNEMKIQVVNMRQGQNLGQAVFGGVNQDQAQDEDEGTVDNVQQPLHGQPLQPSQEQTQSSSSISCFFFRN